MKKYNFLLSGKIKEEICSLTQKSHVWTPTGVVRAMVGDNFSADFYCKKCNKRHTEIYDRNTFGNKRILEELIKWRDKEEEKLYGNKQNNSL